MKTEMSNSFKFQVAELSQVNVKNEVVDEHGASFTNSLNEAHPGILNGEVEEEEEVSDFYIEEEENPVAKKLKPSTVNVVTIEPDEGEDPTQQCFHSIASRTSRYQANSTSSQSSEIESARMNAAHLPQSSLMFGKPDTVRHHPLLVEPAIAVSAVEKHLLSCIEQQSLMIRDLLHNQQCMQQNQRCMQQTMEAILRRSREPSARSASPSSVPLCHQLPLQNTAQFDEVEKQLKENPADLDTLTTSLSSHSTSNTHLDKCVISILKAVLTEELAQKFNFCGKGKKRAFKGTQLQKAINQSVRKISSFYGANYGSIEEVVKKWLRNAPARFERRNLRKALRNAKDIRIQE
ncbi:hypothetical protein CAPTEDRAFT_228629 [Capitella teleta]|uniref:DUF4806 domain-containing protein n=1 Tax=Capitella teleta TaxID=283909 RepID=R7UVL7_CAPTE|nr:hypothetical protein CAPTEDRAFT_228629 [Capitella teleta]|eukprot:ELU10297.1 hypothetical protein CAPTEDRAFT_228629 [Capitella teleta]